MKIALINPPITSKERYGMDIGDIGGHQAPLGLCYIASCLEREGIEACIIDAEAQRLNNRKVISKLFAFRPDAVGLTSTTVAFNRASELARDIKSVYGNIPIVIGGPHVSSNPLHALSGECFDYGVIGEGEITALELFKSIGTGLGRKDIKGVVYKEGRELVRCGPRPYIENLDSLPFPAMHLLRDVNIYRPPLGSYLKTPVVTMVTSRGCPYKCIFCDSNVFGRRTRYHSPEYVISEIENAVASYGAKEIAFLDDTFTLSGERLTSILSLMRKRNIRIQWSCMTRVDTLTKELVRDMKNAGCWQIGVGVESGNQAVLDFIKKGITLKQVKDAVGWCYEYGIYAKGFFMLGHPTDTVNTINETIGFAKSLPLTDVVTAISTPIPGTELFSIAPDYGELHKSDCTEYSYWKAVFVPRGLSEKLLFKKQCQFYSQFYLRYGVIFRQLKKIRSPKAAFKYFVNVIKGAFSLYARIL